MKAVKWFFGLNVAMFVLLRTVGIIMAWIGNSNEYNSLLSLVSLPSNWHLWEHRPWTVVSYMFAQYDFLHLAWNLLWLWLFGTVAAKAITSLKIAIIYVAGGLTGALAFLILGHWMAIEAYMLGASAAVMALVTWGGLRMGAYKVPCPFSANIRLSWIAIVTICLDLAGVAGGNTGGHLAHLGGIMAGVVLALVWNPAQIARHVELQERINMALDKLRQSGYSSLTSDEKKLLNP